MEYSEKVDAVQALNGKFAQAPLAVVAEYRGLTVAQMTELRGKIRAADGEFLVAKNTLVKIALKDTSSELITPLLSGPTAFALGYGDPVGIAKALKDFSEDNEALQLRGGVFEGETLVVADLERLAKMPGRDELRAKFLALLMTPATNLVRLLKAPAQQLVQVLGARKDQIEQ